SPKGVFFPVPFWPFVMAPADPGTRANRSSPTTMTSNRLIPTASFRASPESGLRDYPRADISNHHRFDIGRKTQRASRARRNTAARDAAAGWHHKQNGGGN